MSAVLLADVVVVVLLLYFAHRAITSKHTLPLPPGPRRLPFVGNIRDWPAEQEWLTFTEWGNKYGASRQLLLISTIHKPFTQVAWYTRNYLGNL